MKLVYVFPSCALLISVFSGFYPFVLGQFSTAIVPLLGIVMFGMGMTLAWADFRRVLSRPIVILLGLSLQFLCMPFIAWLIGNLLQLQLPLLVGLLLVGSCPGGTASNVICYLAKGDVALSISITTFSTIVAVLLTPWITWLYIGQSIEVPVQDMMLDILKIIILPVILGSYLNHYLAKYLVRIKKVFPLISMSAIIFIIGIIVSLNQENLTTHVIPVIIAVMLHNTLGLVCGYFIPVSLGYNEKICRTLSIEVGMQNSGLGVALANTFFGSLSALPGAIFSIWHNLSGAAIAAWWAKSRSAIENEN